MKIIIPYKSGYDVYAEIRDNDGYVYNTNEAAFEAFASANRVLGYYAYPMTDASGDLYVSDDDFPNLDAGSYTINAYKGAAYASTDILLTFITKTWDGVAFTTDDISPDITADAYATLTEAETFFINRLSINSWDDATGNNKVKALNQATRLIDRLNFFGDVYDSDQDHQFPRDSDTETPQDIKDACCLIAAKLLEDAEDQRDAGNVDSLSFGKASISYKDTATPYLASGIPSAEAWDLLLPYLRPAGIRLNRV